MILLPWNGLAAAWETINIATKNLKQSTVQDIEVSRDIPKSKYVSKNVLVFKSYRKIQV